MAMKETILQDATLALQNHSLGFDDAKIQRKVETDKDFYHFNTTLTFGLMKGVQSHGCPLFRHTSSQSCRGANAAVCIKAPANAVYMRVSGSLEVQGQNRENLSERLCLLPDDRGLGSSRIL